MGTGANKGIPAELTHVTFVRTSGLLGLQKLHVVEDLGGETPCDELEAAAGLDQITCGHGALPSGES